MMMSATSSLNSIYEQADKKHRTDASCGDACTFLPGEESCGERGDCPSDTKRKGPKTREYHKPLFGLRRLVGVKGVRAAPQGEGDFYQKKCPWGYERGRGDFVKTKRRRPSPGDNTTILPLFRPFAGRGLGKTRTGASIEDICGTS